MDHIYLYSLASAISNNPDSVKLQHLTRVHINNTITHEVYIREDHTYPIVIVDNNRGIYEFKNDTFRNILTYCLSLTLEEQYQINSIAHPVNSDELTIPSYLILDTMLLTMYDMYKGRISSIDVSLPILNYYIEQRLIASARKVQYRDINTMYSNSKPVTCNKRSRAEFEGKIIS